MKTQTVLANIVLTFRVFYFFGVKKLNATFLQINEKMRIECKHTIDVPLSRDLAALFTVLRLASRAVFYASNS